MRPSPKSVHRLKFLEAMGDPGHDRYEELRDWVGGGFDPEDCDVAHINARLVAVDA